MDESRLVKAARVASGMTQQQAAELLDVSLPTYIAREKVPTAFTLDEVARLYGAFSADGKKVLIEFVQGIFLPEEVMLNIKL
mgnify:CR=1 FL=1